MNIPKDLKYTSSHEWVEFLNQTTVRIGITDFAQAAMGDIVFITLPEVNDEAKADTVLTDVESVKAVEDIYSPATGKISAVNETLTDSPEKLNEAPYEAWIAEISDVSETAELLSPEEYAELCAKEEE